MADYPTASFNPATRSAGQTIASSHMNDVQGEIRAIELALLSTGLAHHLLFVDATYDIGASGATRPRALYLSGAATIGGTCYVGDTANANATLGVTINQGAADNEILTVKSSDVAHGMTGITEADTYGFAAKLSDTAGGFRLVGLTDGGTSGALALNAYLDGTALTTKSTAGFGLLRIEASIRSGAGVGAVGADGNLMSVGNDSTVRFILDGDGDSHQDVGTAWTNFDDHDDVLALNALALEVSRASDPYREGIRQQFGEALHAMIPRTELERMKLVTFNEDGHHFVNMSKLTMLHTGALRQLGRQMGQLTRALVQAGVVEPAQLEAAR